MKRLFTSILVASALLIPHLSAVEIVAHRGFSQRAPENTVAAFQLAWQNGTDACELDLYLTADNQIAIIHDKDTKRVAGVQKFIAKSTMQELADLDVGAWKNEKWKGEKIPTLEQALATLPQGDKRFFLEIKCGPEVVPALAKALELMRPRAAQLAIICFERDVCAAAKKALPWIKVYRLAAMKNKKEEIVNPLSKVITETKEDGLDGLDLKTDYPWDAAMVREVHEAGFQLYAWTVNDPAMAKLLAGAGVDGITTDDPVMVRAALAVKP